MTPSQLRNRVFFAGALVALIIALRLIFVTSLIGALITHVSVLICLAYFWRLIDRTPSVRRAAYSDIDGPNQGWDPRTIEAMRRRADGIE